MMSELYCSGCGPIRLVDDGMCGHCGADTVGPHVVERIRVDAMPALAEVRWWKTYIGQLRQRAATACRHGEFCVGCRRGEQGAECRAAQDAWREALALFDEEGGVE